jgi:hypothetical protein
VHTLTVQKPQLTNAILCDEAKKFAIAESTFPEPTLYGATDGKRVGTYFEHKFRVYLQSKYTFKEGNSATGIDFPELGVDMKLTSIRQPQSSCPFKSARQKIYGLGYSLLVFVYDKTDDPATQTGLLNILHAIFVEDNRTGDYQMTTGLRKIIDNKGNKDDIIAFFQDKDLPVDDIEANRLADDVLAKPIEIGYLTMSNARQWRLQYTRVIEKAGEIDGIVRVR